MSTQAMKQALYFLDRLQFDECDPEHIAAITALRAAIEAAERQGQFDTDLDNLCGPSAYARINGKAERQEPVAAMWPTNIDGINAFAFTSVAISEGLKQPGATKLYTTPQPAIPAGMVLDAKRWNFVMMTEPYALNLWNALPKEIYQQERHLNNAIDRAMLAAAPKPGEKE